MKSTTVYLADEQRVKIKKVNRATGIAEAELIRQGVDLMLAKYHDAWEGAKAEEKDVKVNHKWEQSVSNVFCGREDCGLPRSMHGE